MTNINNIGNLASVCVDMCLKTEFRQRKREQMHWLNSQAIEFIISDAISPPIYHQKYLYITP